MNCVYRLYVGLSRDDTPELIDSDYVIAWVTQRVKSLTVSKMDGFFHGQVEGTLIFTIEHDDRRFVIDLAQKLRALLNQDSVGLEYNGDYHLMTYENDPLIRELARQPNRYPNFNVRVYSDLRLHRNWCRANDVNVRVFDNMDGGGWNFFIFEFASLKDAEEFVAEFNIQDENSLWTETAPEGQILDIKTSGPVRTNEFTAQFRSATIKELVDAYNQLVRSQGWVSAKGRYRAALLDEFKHRHIDISAVKPGGKLHFDQLMTTAAPFDTSEP